MKKRLVIASVIIIGLFILIIGMNLFPFLFKFISLSPFFQELAPFEASVTIKNENTAPIIENLSEEILICEEQYLSSYFNISDQEGGPLTEIKIEPTMPFFIEPTSILKSDSLTRFDARIFSVYLDKSRVNRTQGYRTYRRIISASDGEFSDTKFINITVIEINNAPLMQTIGVRTVWTQGDDNSFYHQVQVSDVEDGNQNAGRLGFNISFLNGAPRLFNISLNGTMNFTPAIDMNLSEVNLPITYNISVCVNDTGLFAIHENITDICGQDGLPISRCQRFSLTITEDNRRPMIIDYFSKYLEFNALGSDNIYFNITDRDPDGTIPDSYWYVDDNLIEYDNSSLFDEFYFTFGCGLSGKHRVRVVSTDGLLNDSLTWNVSVSAVDCPVVSGGGGGGGGGGIPMKKCEEKWGCDNWNVCQDLAVSLSMGLVDGEKFRTLKEGCRNDFFEENCGFQIRNCFDINSCNTSVKKPEEINYCNFVKNPSCWDGVKNCHDGSCELLIDCGGSCEQCASCSDGKKNQGEEEADCGGPCPNACPPRVPLLKINYAQFGTIGIFLFILLLILIAIYLINRILKERRTMNEKFKNVIIQKK